MHRNTCHDSHVGGTLRTKGTNRMQADGGDTLDTLERESVDAGEPESEARSDKVVFISYRVHPDQVVAAGVKKLIESTLKPRPHVFVSGLGGLKPSSVGFKPQLQRAIQAASVIVGIISPNSKDREWIFYEAGAAWGRGAVYVPLLIQLEHNELPSSIAEYQAYRATDRDDLERLISALAEILGAEKRSRFGVWVAAFQRQLASPKTLSEVNEPDNPLIKAMTSMLEGDMGAAALFDDLERTTTDPDELVRVKVIRAAGQCKWVGPKVLEDLAAFEARLKDTVEFAYWSSYFEPRPGVAISGFRDALQRKTSATRRARLYGELCSRLKRAGHDLEAVETCLLGLGESSREVRIQCCTSLCGMRQHVSPVAELLFAAVAASLDPSASAFERGVSAAERYEFVTLRVYFATEYFSKASDSRSANELGRAYEAAGLKSVAYQRYMEAGERGSAVGWLNAAQLLGNGELPAAGLALLARHKGEWDASAADYPYDVRARLEKAVADEFETAVAMENRGRRTFEMLLELAEHAFANELPKSGAKLTIDIPDGESFTVHFDGNLQYPFPVWGMPLVRLTHVELEDDVTVVFVRRPQSAIGLAYSLAANDFEPRWVKIQEASGDDRQVDMKTEQSN